MKKIIYGIFLFISIFFISNNVNAIDNGSVRCQYKKDAEDFATLVFNIDNGRSSLGLVKIREHNEETVESYEHTTSIVVTSAEECPDSVRISSSGVFENGEWQLDSTNSAENNTPSWLGDTDKVSCGGIGPFSRTIPKITSLIITIISIAAPVMLVIMGTVDFFKSTMAGKEDMVKKNQKAFIDRLIAAVLLFLIIVLVKLFVGIVSKGLGTNSGVVGCIDCFVSNHCKAVTPNK